MVNVQKIESVAEIMNELVSELLSEQDCKAAEVLFALKAVLEQYVEIEKNSHSPLPISTSSQATIC